MRFISLRIIDLQDPQLTEHLGYVEASKITAVRPSKTMMNAQDVQQDKRTLPQWKKFTTVHVDGMGAIPCSDPVEFVMARLTGKDPDDFK